MKRKIFLAVIFLLALAFNVKGDNQVKEYFITCDPADFEYIYANYWEDIYIPVTIAFDGTTWDDVQMRIRGDGSRMFPKKSLKVKFGGNPFVTGSYELNLNAEWEDESYMRAFLSSRVFRQAGQTCFDTEFVRLYLNGTFLGLYNSIQNVDEEFLQANGYDPDGNLYKADKDGACLSIYDDIPNFWTLETGSGNKEDLTTFISEINQVTDDEYLQFCQQQMDYDQMINIIACNMILSNHSTYYHNYFMYHDVNGSNKWEMMPWDLDKTLSVYAWKNYTNSSAPWVPDNPFLERALLNPTIFADIRSRVQEIGSQILTTANLWPMIDSLVTVLQPSVEEDTTDNIETVQQWLDKVNVEKTYIANWLDQIQWQFNHVQSTFTATRTPGFSSPNVTFNWTPSIDPDGGSVYYRFSLTTNAFEPETTTNFDNISTTSLSLTNLAEGDYFWKVTSVKGEQEVEAFDSKNPLQITVMETLPCTISSDLEIFNTNSPYLVNCNVTVEPQASLIIHEGVTLLFENNTFLKVTGGLEVNGTKENPVYFKPFLEEGSFDSLVFINTAQDIHLNYLNLIGGVIHANTANITFDNCQVMLSNKHLVGQNVIYGHYNGAVVIKNSQFYGNNTGQGLELAWCESAVVENCSFSLLDDPIEFISIPEGYVHNNTLKLSNDDGIDFNNCKNLSIKNNLIYDCSDNGISIGNEFNGPCENILIENNLVVNCAYGMTVKDGSNAIISNNTFYQCGTGFKLWEKNPGLGGGQAVLKNTIISATTNQVLDVDEHSQIQISYSICDTETLGGSGNLFANPQFVAPADSNFQLLPDSPCINAGDPASPADPDGTRADIGAYYFNFGAYNVIFNEINYKSANDFDTGDWVELYNIDESEADISGWIFKDSDDNHIFEIPAGTIIQPGDYLVLCAELPLFRQLYPDLENAIGDFSFGLSSSGELIRLYNHTGIMIDSVVYGNASPWPTEPNGQGPTLELKNPFLDNSLGQNWAASEAHGTPGAINSCFVSNSIIESGDGFLVNVFPNPSNGKFQIDFYCQDSGTAVISVFNYTGKLVKELTQEVTTPGITSVKINETLNPGLFIVRINLNSNTLSGKLLVK
jgi:parallel beta-helix repeat protein